VSELAFIGSVGSYSERVPVPRPGSINTIYDAARVRTMAMALGMPRPVLTSECQVKHAPRRVTELLVTEDVGPFTITGIRPFVELCARVFERVHVAHPDLYAVLGTAGCLCVRLVRGSDTQPSNHCWGTAIDIKIDGILDTRGDGLVQRGLLALYPYFKAEKCFWGAGFRVEDGMHFEASDQLIREWARSGVI